MRSRYRRRPAPVDGAARLHALVGAVAVPPSALGTGHAPARAGAEPVAVAPEPAAAGEPAAVAREPALAAAVEPRPAPAGWDLLDPSRRGLAALAVVGLLAAGFAGVLVWRSRPAPVPVAPPTPVESGATGVVVVDVAGAVRRPGLVRLPVGSRVADALTAAGGPLPGASTAGLNLARRLADGEQVVVGAPGASASAAPGRLDLNLATVEQLDALPGVGPVLAERIVAWRTEHGRFASVEQLREVPGIGDKKFAELAELVTA